MRPVPGEVLEKKLVLGGARWKEGSLRTETCKDDGHGANVERDNFLSLPGGHAKLNNSHYL